MKNLVVFFYIDALNSRFLSHDIMPFLSKLATKHHYFELENVLGYSFAIQSSMLSGKYPDEINHWMPYFYCPETSPILFRTLNTVNKLLALDKLQTIRYFLISGSRRFFLRKGVQANNTPLSIINKIALYPYYYMCEIPFFLELKELLRKKLQTALTYIGPPKQRTNVYKALFKHLRTSKHENEVIIVYDDSLDGRGHAFGPYSSQCLNYARTLDSALAAIYQKLINLYGNNLNFLVFSDHGQSNLKFQIDVLSKLSKRGLKFGVDYVCFVDATLALFWPEDNLAKEKILRALNEVGRGIIIDENARRKYHLEFKDNKYGEVIYLLEAGGTFVPNFFSPFGAMKGLHGYLPEDEVQKSFLISNKEPSIQLTHIKDIRRLLMNYF